MDEQDLIQDLVEITFPEKDDFLKIRETLSRIGVASRKEKELFQSCHILHKKGKYYIVHFKNYSNLMVNKLILMSQMLVEEILS